MYPVPSTSLDVFARLWLGRPSFRLRGHSLIELRVDLSSMTSFQLLKANHGLPTCPHLSELCKLRPQQVQRTCCSAGAMVHLVLSSSRVPLGSVGAWATPASRAPRSKPWRVPRGAGQASLQTNRLRLRRFFRLKAKRVANPPVSLHRGKSTSVMIVGVLAVPSQLHAVDWRPGVVTPVRVF